MVTQREKWRQLAAEWYDSGPPSTPSREDLEIYESLLAHEKHRRVAILGCTPSLRRLCGELGAGEVVVVDFVAQMFERTSVIIEPSWPERFVEADWCEDWNWPDVADVVLGDRALDHVELERRRAFFEQVAGHLRPGGLFVCHTAVDSDVLAAQSALAVVRNWSLEWYHGMSLQDCVDGLWDDLLSIGRTRKGTGAVLSVAELWPALSTIAQGKGAERGADARLVLALERRYGAAIEAEWFTGTIRAIEADASGSFELEDVRRAGDYRAAEHHPFLILRKPRQA